MMQLTSYQSRMQYLYDLTSGGCQDGITLNYQGSNTVALTLWTQQPGGAKIEGLSLTAGVLVLTVLKDLALVPMPKYVHRAGAY